MEQRQSSAGKTSPDLWSADISWQPPEGREKGQGLAPKSVQEGKFSGILAKSGLSLKIIKKKKTEQENSHPHIKLQNPRTALKAAGGGDGSEFQDTPRAVPQFPRGLSRDGAREIPCWNAPRAGNEERHLPKEERNETEAPGLKSRRWRRSGKSRRRFHGRSHKSGFTGGG